MAYDWQKKYDSGVIRRVLKVSTHGAGFVVTLEPDGSLVEYDIREPDDTWTGSWEFQGDGLVISVGSYEVQTAGKSMRATETNAEDASRGPVAFYLLPECRPLDAWLDLEPTLVTFREDGSVKALTSGPAPQAPREQFYLEYDLFRGKRAGYVDASRYQLIPPDSSLAGDPLTLAPEIFETEFFIQQFGDYSGLPGMVVHVERGIE